MHTAPILAHPPPGRKLVTRAVTSPSAMADEDKKDEGKEFPSVTDAYLAAIELIAKNTEDSPVQAALRALQMSKWLPPFDSETRGGCTVLAWPTIERIAAKEAQPFGNGGCELLWRCAPPGNLGSVHVMHYREFVRGRIAVPIDREPAATTKDTENQRAENDCKVKCAAITRQELWHDRPQGSYRDNKFSDLRLWTTPCVFNLMCTNEAKDCHSFIVYHPGSAMVSAAQTCELYHNYVVCLCDDRAYTLHVSKLYENPVGWAGPSANLWRTSILDFVREKKADLETSWGPLDINEAVVRVKGCVGVYLANAGLTRGLPEGEEEPFRPGSPEF